MSSFIEKLLRISQKNIPLIVAVLIIIKWAVSVRLCKPEGEGKEASSRSELAGVIQLQFILLCRCARRDSSGSPAAPADHIKCTVVPLSSLPSNKYLEGSVSVCRAAL